MLLGALSFLSLYFGVLFVSVYQGLLSKVRKLRAKVGVGKYKHISEPASGGKKLQNRV